jgi:hypothetical protein
MVGLWSTLKNRGDRRSWSRIAFPVLIDARSMVAVTCERVRSLAVMTVLWSSSNRPPTLLIRCRTVNPTVPCAGSIVHVPAVIPLSAATSRD